MEQRRVTLPDCLMKAAKAIGESSDMTPVERLEAIVLMVHGYGLVDRHEGQLDTSAMAIPEPQWAEVCEILMHLGDGDAIARVNLGLDWVNVGPSGYKMRAPVVEAAIDLGFME